MIILIVRYPAFYSSMEQQQAASSSSSDQHKAVRKKDNNQAFLFDYIPIVDATALANLFDQLRVETK